MERFFNTAGPQIPDINYTIDPLSRLNLDEMLSLIRQQRYFVLHAPRQTGKTSCMLALRDYLNGRSSESRQARLDGRVATDEGEANGQGEYIAVYANVEGGQASRNDVQSVVKSTVDILAEETSGIIDSNLPLEVAESVENTGKDAMLSTFLRRLAMRVSRPLVFFIDEIDALVGDSLVSILRQLRAGYANRPAAFPQSVVLCGVRDVRDYRIVLSNQDIITGGSAFNIKAESLRLGNFSKEEIHELYMQHTHETGQQWDESCFPMVWEATEGQPWLVNALANEVTSEMEEGRDRSVTITPEMIYRAKERIIYRRDTHIDQLIDKLKEPRVRRIVQQLLLQKIDFDSGIPEMDDYDYLEENGIIIKERGKRTRLSNSIYCQIAKSIYDID